ncbi:MAG: hypothetical protein JWP81_1010 [Ferruginibacter sp.]|nr:hypothetical protein [Ferruginibacter sp.]
MKKYKFSMAVVAAIIAITGAFAFNIPVKKEAKLPTRKPQLFSQGGPWCGNTQNGWW